MKTKEMYVVLRKEILKAIGLVIRRKRRRVNMSQQELAEVLGVTKSSISRYEAGKMEIPSSSLPVISDCCRFPVKDFTDAMQSEIDLSSVENIEEYHLMAIENEETCPSSSQNANYKTLGSAFFFNYSEMEPFFISSKDLEDYNNGIRTNTHFEGPFGAFLRSMAVAYKCWSEDGYFQQECGHCRKEYFCKSFENLFKKDN